MAVSEQYPDFKFPDQFTGLMTEIEGANNRITVAQTRYNKAIKEFNTYILSFPGNTVAAKKGYVKRVPLPVRPGRDQARRGDGPGPVARAICCT